MRELVAMNTQNQIYEVQFYVRPDAPVNRSERSAVNVAYLRLPRSVRGEFDRAVRWSGEGKHEKSVTSLKKVVALEPGFAPAHNQMGIDLYNLRRSEEAAQAFRRAIQLDPRSAHAFVNLGKLLNESGNHLEAIEFLKAGVSVDPGSCLGFFQLGIAYYQANRYPEARTALQEAAALNSRDGVVALYLGLTAEAQNDLPAAREAGKCPDGLSQKRTCPNQAIRSPPDLPAFPPI